APPRACALGHACDAPPFRAERDRAVVHLLVRLAFGAVDDRARLPRRPDHVRETLAVGAEGEAREVDSVLVALERLALVAIEDDDRVTDGRRRVGDVLAVAAEARRAGPGVGDAFGAVEDQQLLPARPRNVRQPGA